MKKMLIVLSAIGALSLAGCGDLIIPGTNPFYPDGDIGIGDGSGSGGSSGGSGGSTTPPITNPIPSYSEIYGEYEFTVASYLRCDRQAIVTNSNGHLSNFDESNVPAKNIFDINKEIAGTATVEKVGSNVRITTTVNYDYKKPIEHFTKECNDEITNYKTTKIVYEFPESQLNVTEALLMTTSPQKGYNIVTPNVGTQNNEFAVGFSKTNYGTIHMFLTAATKLMTSENGYTVSDHVANKVMK